MANKMLTPEQEQMFTDNYKLVYKAINMYITNPGQYGLNDYEDLTQIASLALCHAITTYRPEKGSFSNYALNVIRNKLYNSIRDNNDVADLSESTSEPMVEMNASLAYNNIDTFYEAHAKQEQDELLERIGIKYGGIAQKGVEALKLMMDGYSCKDIAEIYGTDDRTITAWISRARSKLKKEPEILKLVKEEIY